MANITEDQLLRALWDASDNGTIPEVNDVEEQSRSLNGYVGHKGVVIHWQDGGVSRITIEG